MNIPNLSHILTKNQLIAIVLTLVATGSFLFNAQQERNQQTEMAKRKLEQISTEAFNKRWSESDRQENIDKCIEDAKGVYNADWDNTCVNMGYATDCGLPAARAKDLDARFEKAKDLCVKRY